jgi:hypothetical protein
MILFGAGASAYSGSVEPHAPPLGNDLFDSLVAFDPFFAAIPAGLADRFRKNFEEGMEAYRTRVDLLTFLQRMSLYFLRFSILNHNRNFYSKLLYLTGRLKNNYVFATLNYDLLLDQALLHRGLISNWAETEKIVKLHGSPNYVIDEVIAAGLRSNVIVSSHRTAARVGAPTRVVDPDTARRHCQRYDVAPAISAYAIGKKVFYGDERVLHQQKLFIEHLETISSIAVIGVNLNENDTHIWGPLANTKAKIGIVNPDLAQYERWASARGIIVRQLCQKVGDIFAPSNTEDFIKFLDS